MHVQSSQQVYSSGPGLRPMCPRPHDFAVTEIVVHSSNETKRLYPVAGGFSERESDDSGNSQSRSESSGLQS